MTADDLLLSAPVAAPLLAAGCALLLSPRPALQRVLGIVVLAAVVADAIVLLARADGQGPLVMSVGGHAQPLGITLIADRFAALALAVSALVLLAVLIYAVGQGGAEGRTGVVPSVFHPSYLVLTAGVSLAFLTGDLFNLFVALEVMLMASYALITLGATPDRVRAAAIYVVTSLLSSMVLLTTIGVVYGLTGTLNLADLSRRTADLPADVRAWLSIMLLVALAIKAAIIPLHWWLAESYPPAPAPVTAVFAALLTKVAMYAILRTQSLLFPREEPWPLLLALAAVTMVGGALAALAQRHLHRMLAFLLVSHMGFMLLGLAVSSVAGTAGAVVFLVHHIVVQASLFLVAGLVEHHRGTGDVARLGGLMVTAPAVSALFLVPALSIGGVPPTSGFVAKLAVLEAAVASGGVPALLLAAAGVVVSLLTLAVMMRVWTQAFWGDPAPPAPDMEYDAGHGPHAHVPTMLVATASVVALGAAVVVAAGPLTELTFRIGEDLRGGDVYREAILGRGHQ